MERNLSRNVCMNFGMDQGGGWWQYNHIMPIKTEHPLGITAMNLS